MVTMPCGKPSKLWVRITLLISMAVAGLPAASGFCGSSVQGGTLQRDVPLQQIVRDLESYIPRRLHEANIPGLSIVLIRGYQISWQRGFGVRNRYTGEPVTPQTVMQVGSISKAVGAYGALKLADHGVIALDTPLDDYLERPWLDDPEGRRKITMRLVLTHTSGLSNDVRSGNRDLLFPPGERYSYSGMGFLYLQEVIETVQGQTVNAIMEDEIFEPLKMSSASFDPEFEPADDVAAGHLPLPDINTMVLLPFAVVASVLAALGLAINRVRRKTWSLGWKGRLVAAVGPALVVATLLASVLGVSFLVAVFVATSAFLAFVTIVFFVGIWLVRRWSSRPPYSGVKRAGLVLSWFVAVFATLSVASGGVLVPVPGAPSRNGSLAWSLHATAEDLARFALAMMSMDQDDSSLTRQMMIPQIGLSERTAWGMGVGQREGEDGRAFFHTGHNPGFESLLFGFPGSGAGIVILTNGSGGLQVAQDIALRVLGPSAAELHAAISGNE